jgi:hypothetical protein
VTGDEADLAAERFFDGHPFALEVYRAVREVLSSRGPTQVRVTKSQVAFRCRKAFAWLWMPGRWLRDPGAEVVLSVALAERDPSPRFKQVEHPAANVWMHHLEIHGLDDLDQEVQTWLARAYEGA